MEVRNIVFVLFIGASCLVLAEDQTKAMMYLSQYGYLPPAVLNPSSGLLLSKDTMTEALKKFQAFAGLNVTGELDDETKKTMSLPRCAVKDIVSLPTGARSKRFAYLGGKWTVKDLTYKISKYPRHLSLIDTDLEIKKAFSLWSDVTPLTFTKKGYGPVDIEIKFEGGAHGDGNLFDGPGGILAHTFSPYDGGDVHFDDSEAWTANTYRGTNLFQVAAHEIGHSLGLDHSKIRSALMAPFYRSYQPNFKLHKDDIDGIQSLYGKNDKLPNDATFDIKFNSGGVTYVFKDKPSMKRNEKKCYWISGMVVCFSHS